MSKTRILAGTVSANNVLADGQVSAGELIGSVPIIAGTSGTLSVARGGTGIGNLTAGNILIGDNTSAIEASSLLTKAPAVTSGTYIKSIGYADTVVALGNTGTAKDIDVFTAGVFTATLTGNCTFNIRFPVATGASSFTLVLTNDGTSGRSISFSGGTFLFPLGITSFDRTTAANATDIWVFFTPDGGSTYYANVAMKDVKA